MKIPGNRNTADRRNERFWKNVKQVISEPWFLNFDNTVITWKAC